MVPVHRGIALAAALLAVSHTRAEPVAPTLADVRVFAVYEPVFSQQDVDLLSRVHPDFVCRGWFKWHHTPDWQAYAPLAHACREQGILLQGGLTCAALYPGENGIDDATFRDFACHGTDGQPFLCRQADHGGWYHLSLYNPKVIAMLKREARLQLDAGAAGIWYDEIEGYYDWNPTEGYDPYACAAFRDWLVRKYCAGQGWRDDDPRWQTQFGIDLAKHGGTIRTFDYLRHLQTTPGKDGKPLADNPPQGHPRAWASSPSPLYREWGFAWDRNAAGTFRFDTVATLFADLLADADRYAREKYGRTLLSTYNHNGTARRGVAFQQPHNGAQPPLRHGRLDGRASYLSFYEDLIADAAEVCPEQPVVFFVDWPGETDRLVALPRSDQTHFFSLYIPEAYAAGGEFALPLRGYSYVAAHQGTLATLARLADFYRERAPWLRASRLAPAQPERQDSLTLRARTSACGTAIHIVNHAFSTRDLWPQPRTNLTVTIDWSGPVPNRASISASAWSCERLSTASPSSSNANPPGGGRGCAEPSLLLAPVGPVPGSAFAVSPDFPEQRPVPLALKDGRLTLEVGTLFRSALVILPNADALRRVTGAASDGTHILDPQGRALAVARNGRFTLWLPPIAFVIECLETGERLPARDGAAFAPPPGGGFASGLLLDTFGIPARHAEIASGPRRWHTDAWGRYRVPLVQLAAGPLTACVEPGTTNTLPAHTAFTAWRIRATRIPILSLPPLEHPREPQDAASLGGFWANWPDKERAPGVIALARDDHAGRPALRCTFSPTPRAPWSNINSPAFEIGDADAVELTYAGDGSPRTVYAVLHAPPRFFRHPLTLASTEWATARIALRDFRDDRGAAFDPAAASHAASFQLSPAFGGSASPPTAAPATLWLHAASLVNVTPVKEEWHSDAAFDDVDVDNLQAEHKPLPPPPAIANRQPLVHFTAPAPKLLANWDGKGADDVKPLVVIERVAPSDKAPFLRVTFPAGECAWGNANIPLPSAQLKDADGLALRLRASPSDDVALALHTASPAGQRFFRADAETAEAWVDVVLPWSQFLGDDGKPFAPASAAWLNLQLCRPARTLKQNVVVDIEAVDGFTVNPQVPVRNPR